MQGSGFTYQQGGTEEEMSEEFDDEKLKLTVGRFS